jgi:hypothetical protein
MTMRILVVAMLLILPTIKMFGQYYWVAKTSPSSWNAAANWSNVSGGSGGFGIPSASDQVIFDGASSSNGNCVLDVARSISAITMNGYTGVIDLSGNNLTLSTVITNSIFSTGKITNSSSTTASLSITNTSGSVTFSGTMFDTQINIVTSSRGLSLNGSVFFVNGSSTNGTCTFQLLDVTGTSTSTGGNTFNGPVSFVLTASTNTPQLLLTSTNPDVFNSTVNVSLTGNASRAPIIKFATGNNCTFNGNVTLSSNYSTSNNAFGTYFGNGVNSTAAPSTGGTSTLSSNATLSLGSSYRGLLRIEKLVSQSTSATNLSLTSDINSLLIIGASTFNGSVTGDAGRLFIATSNFYGSANQFTARCAGVTSQIGAGNTFGTSGATSTTTFERTALTGTFDVGINSLGSLSFITATGNDTYNGDVLFRYSGGGSTCLMRPAYSANSNYGGNISWNTNSTSPMYFGLGGSTPTITCINGLDQSINKVSGNGDFGAMSLIMNKTGNGKLTLNTPLSIPNVTFGVGTIYTTATNLLTFLNGGTVTGASNLSYVDGPVARNASTGSGFTFPTGNNGHYGPIQISAASSGADLFTAQNFLSTSNNVGSSVNSPLVIVSGCEYWNLTRTGTTSNVGVTLSWNSSDCNPSPYISATSDLRVAQFSSGAWNGLSSTLGSASNSSGTISSSTLSTFGYFALGSVSLSNTLPIELKNFESERSSQSITLKWTTGTEINNDYFVVEKKTSSSAFLVLAKVEASENSSGQKYQYTDDHPVKGNNYYRLKQVDLNGHITYSNTIRQEFELADALNVYPNPGDHNHIMHMSMRGDFSILNLHGYLIMSLRDTDEFECTNLEPGAYILLSSQGQRCKFSVR